MRNGQETVNHTVRYDTVSGASQILGTTCVFDFLQLDVCRLWMSVSSE
jgi:hypothetical protein